MAKFYGDEVGFFWEDISLGNLPGLPTAKQKRAPTAKAQRRGPRPESAWQYPRTFPRLHNCLVGLDIETRDPGIGSGHGPGWCFTDRAQWGEIIGIAICWGDAPDQRAYYPFAHPELPPDLPYTLSSFLEQLRAWFGDPTIGWICHNTTYDMGWITGAYKLPWPAGPVEDSEVMASLINENRWRFNLDALSKSELGQEKDETLLRAAASHFGADPKSEMYLIPAPFVGPYTEQDAYLPRALYLHFQQHAEWGALSGSIYPIERDLTPVLIAMRMQGVPVDLDAAVQLRERWHAEELASTNALQALAGFPLSIWSEQDIAKACDTVLGLKYPRTMPTKRFPEGSPSFTKPWMEKQQGIPFFQHLVRARKFQKIGGTFIDGYLLGCNVGGRVHTEFHQIKRDDSGTVSGRLSSSNPNLQNIPVRDTEVGPAMRALFVPDVGAEWLCTDYSQQEPRLTVHYSALLGARGAAEAVRTWRENPRMDFHQFMSDLTGLIRGRAKNLFLGCCYGMSAPTLCRHVGLPVYVDAQGKEHAGEEGLRMFSLFHAKAPFVNDVSDHCKRAVRKRGYIRTIGGRRCHFERDANGTVQWPHKALNRLIQGSAADMIKKAMVEAYRLYRMVPLLSVHDELDQNTTDAENDTKKLVKVMEDVYELKVPVVVDAGVGANWHLAKEAA